MKNEQMPYEEAKREFEQQISKGNTGDIHIHIHIHGDKSNDPTELAKIVTDTISKAKMAK